MENMEIVESEPSTSGGRYSVETRDDGTMMLVHHIGPTDSTENVCSSGDGKLPDDLEYLTNGSITNEDGVEILLQEIETLGFDSSGIEISKHDSSELQFNDDEDEDEDLFLNGSHEETESCQVGAVVDVDQPQAMVLSKQKSAVKEKPWPMLKTKALLSYIRKKQNKFKKGRKTRKEIWTEISKELQLAGFTQCDRDECGKKWDNLFRTYKNVLERDGKSASWELFNTVRDLVKILQWPNPPPSIRKIPFSGPPVDVNRLIEVMEAQKEQRNLCRSSFLEHVRILNNQRDELLKVIGATGRTENLGNKELKELLHKETRNTDLELEDLIDNSEAENTGTESSAEPPSDLAGPLQMHFPVHLRQTSDSTDDHFTESGLYFLRMVNDKVSGNPMYEIFAVTEENLATEGAPGSLLSKVI